jgi:BirA family biotin operon repressor/biotin-[acetyl-CoA-carboxylase] ligase
VTDADHFPAPLAGVYSPPDDWHRLELPDVHARWTVWSIDETGSTNTDLLEAAAHGAPDHTVLVAGHQTAGRGRLDRRWEAPPHANLLVSILFRTVPIPAGDLTRRVGLAAVDAVREATGATAVLKWPNDLFLHGRKLAGVLAQRAAAGPVVVGLGLNLGWAPSDAAKLDDVAAGLTPHELLAAVLCAYDSLPGDVHDRYCRALETLGKAVRVEQPTGVIEGRAVDVERDGRLVVVDACAVTHRIDAGDVFLRAQ